MSSFLPLGPTRAGGGPAEPLPRSAPALDLVQEGPVVPPARSPAGLPTAAQTRASVDEEVETWQSAAGDGHPGEGTLSSTHNLQVVGTQNGLVGFFSPKGGNWKVYI